jgi:CheY-like chemotaxis protein
MSKKLILCVDDEKIVLDSLQAQLSRSLGKQFDYEFAESGEEALEILDEFSSDNVDILVIVSDWLMPNMKGDELLMKVHQQFPSIKKIMLTGQADQDSIDKVSTHITDLKVLSKPWKEEDIINAIKTGFNENAL